VSGVQTAATAVVRQHGGWWHDYVCPTHGVELEPPLESPGEPPIGETFRCSYGCEFSGEPYISAATVFRHQAAAREARRLARRSMQGGDAAAADCDRSRAITIVRDFADYYREVNAGGWSASSESWMLRGKLFSQALTEAIWATQLADAVIVLAEGIVPTEGDAAARASADHPPLVWGDSVVDMLTGLLHTITDARQTLVVDQTNPTSNYVAWLDSAGGLLSRALLVLGHEADATVWVERTFEHLAIAIGDDGWEWEGSTYYHLFVLRAYLLNLRRLEPIVLPEAGLRRLRSMVDVLAAVAAPSGMLPSLHDGPYDRSGAHREVLEVCVLAGQLWNDTRLGAVEAFARSRLAAVDALDGLEGLLSGWFAGPALTTAGAGREDHAAASVGTATSASTAAPGNAASTTPARPSRLFERTGYAVLRDPADTWQAVLDAGPHGGSHGHLDKLGLYLYGRDAAWQPAPGVPPYGSDLRRGYYSRTEAHPTVRIDGTDQYPTTAVIDVWDQPTPTCRLTRAVAHTHDAFDGVSFTRQLLMTGEFLLDVVHVTVADGSERDLTLALRPAVAIDVRAIDGGWKSVWAPEIGTKLHGLHRSSVASTLRAGPGRGPSDDPAAPFTVADWTAHSCDAVFVSTFAPEGAPDAPPVVSSIELVHGEPTGKPTSNPAVGIAQPSAVVVTLADGTTVTEMLV
jgi:hypothetical protein